MNKKEKESFMKFIKGICIFLIIGTIILIVGVLFTVGRFTGWFT